MDFIQQPSDIHGTETMPESAFSFFTSERRGSFGSIVIKEVWPWHDCMPTDGWYQLKQKSDQAEGDIKNLGFQNGLDYSILS